MEELVDLIATDGSANDVHDKIEALRPGYSTAMFDNSEVEAEPEQEVAQEEE